MLLQVSAVQRGRAGAVHQEEGRLGAALDQRPALHLRRAPRLLRRRRGHLLLRLVRRHLLAEEARRHAGVDLQQRAHQSRRGKHCGVI